MIIRSSRVASRLAAIVVAAMFAVLLVAAPADAHGFLERSEPPDGGSVALGRSSLTLWFSEPISAEARTFEMATLDGVRAAFSVDVSNSDDEGFVEIQTGTLQKTTYLLKWSVVSLDDGHAYNGTILFGVGIRPDTASAIGNGLPDTLDLVFRWVELSALMLVVGALAVSGRVLGSMGGLGNGPRRRAYRIGAIAGTVAVITAVATPYLRVPRGGDSLQGWSEAAWTLVSGTSWGQSWIIRGIALIVLTVVMWSRVLRRDGFNTKSPIDMVALVLVIGLEALAGHASALPRLSAVAAFVSATHLAAAGVWVGGLAVLALCIFPAMRRNKDSQGPILATVWRSFSPIAAIAAAVVVATGVYETGRHVPDMSWISSSVYGKAVVAKVILVMLALVLAGFNTLLINPRLAAPVGRLLGRREGWAPMPLGRFTTVAVVEAAVLVVAIGVAALLTSVSTAREIESAAQETTPYSAEVDGLFITYEVVPAGRNETRLIVRTAAVVKPIPGEVTGAEVVLVDPTGDTLDLTLEEIEPSRYEVETTKLAAGDWAATVSVQRGNTPDIVTGFEWEIEELDLDAARPLEFVATGFALLIVLAMAGVVWLGRRQEEQQEEQRPLVEVGSGR